MKKFENFIFWILDSKFRKTLVIVLTILAFFASLLMFPSKAVLARMLPGKSATTFSIYVDTPTGSSIKQTKKVTDCISSVLEKEKSILDISTFYGQGIPLDYAGLVKGSMMKRTENVAEISINLTPIHERDEPSFLMVSRLRPVLNKECSSVVAGTTIKLVEQPSGPPTLAQIVVEVQGKNFEKMRKLSTEVANILSHTKDLVDVDILADDIYDTYKLIPDVKKIADESLSVEQVNNILYLSFEGMSIAAKNSEHSLVQIPIFLVLDDKNRRMKGDDAKAIKDKLSKLNLMNRLGEQISVDEVVKIVKVKSSPTIMHKDLKRTINVIAETDNVSQVYPLLDARETMMEYFKSKYIVDTVGLSTYMFDLKLKE